MYYLILLFFFISGACGLIYEVVWSREFILVLGGTTKAVTAVVVAYMGGLGLGSLIGGRLVDKSETSPVVIYGVLEGAIALFAVLVPLFLRLAAPLLGFLYNRLGYESWIYDMSRFAVSILILFPPTLMMGATLPVLVKATLFEREKFGLTAGRLYGINTLGAMLGAGVAGYLLLPLLGNRFTTFTAAGANLLICVLVLALRRRFTTPEVSSPEPETTRASAGEVARNWIILVILAGYGLSGLATLIYQIAWTRYLSLTLGGSTYSFSLILVAFIGGLGLGGIVMSFFVDKIKRPLLWAGLMEFAIGAAAILVMPILDNISERMFFWVHQTRNSMGTFFVLRFAVAFGILAVPTLVMGALLPLIAGSVGRSHKGVGEPMGWVYAANTAGAVMGSFLAGYVLIHYLGIRTTVMLATVLSFAIGMVWLFFSELKRKVSVAAGVCVMAAALSGIYFLPAANPIMINSGPFVYANRIGELSPGQTVEDWMEEIYRVIYFREDVEVTASVNEDRITKDLSLRINGKTDASTSKDMENQILLAQLPLLFHPNPKKVMLVGLASGVSAGSALKHPIERLDCFELSEAVVEASKYFKEASGLDYDDPRLNLVVNDARNHLKLTDEKYDVIMNGPSNPWQAGQGILFTREYFTLFREHLTPGGYAVAWASAYNNNAETLAMVFHTFAEVFPEVTLWEAYESGDYILIGSMEPQRVPLSRVESRLERDKIAEDLARIDTDLEVIMARFIMGKSNLMKSVSDVPLHTDDRLQLEFELPKAKFFTKEMQRLPAIIRKILVNHESAQAFFELPQGDAGSALLVKLREMNRSRSDYLSMRLSLYSGNLTQVEILSQVEDYVDRSENPYLKQKAAQELTEFNRTMGDIRMDEGKKEQAAIYYRRAYERNPEDSASAANIAVIRYEAGDLEDAKKWALRAIERMPDNHNALTLLANISRQGGDYAAEERYIRRALEIWPENDYYRMLWGRALLDIGEIKRSRQVLEWIAENRPELVDARLHLAEINIITQKPEQALFHFERFLELAPDDHEMRPAIESAVKELKTRIKTQ